MKMSEQHYKNWGVTDFMADPSFQEWVRAAGAAEELNSYWQRVQQLHPELVPVMEEAAAQLREWWPEKILSDPEGEQLVWQAIQRDIETVADTPVIASRKLIRWPAVAAAVLLLLGGAAIITWLQQSPSPSPMQVSASTDNRGQFRLISLPDSSKVMLGANSTIRYNENWNRKGVREVWLRGDAHFEIKHLNTNDSEVAEHEKFLVHVNDQLEIEVLGTVFNVWNRNGRTEVELTSGKVKLRLKDTGKELILRPGEVASVIGSSLQLDAEQSDLVLQGPDHDTLYQLNNTSVAEIIDLIEKTYGKNVIVEDTSLLSRRIDGVLPLCHEKDLLFALSGILDIRVRQMNAQTWIFNTAE